MYGYRENGNWALSTTLIRRYWIFRFSRLATGHVMHIRRRQPHTEKPIHTFVVWSSRPSSQHQMILKQRTGEPLVAWPFRKSSATSGNWIYLFAHWAERCCLPFYFSLLCKVTLNTLIAPSQLVKQWHTHIRLLVAQIHFGRSFVHAFDWYCIISTILRWASRLGRYFIRVKAYALKMKLISFSLN